MNKSEPKAPNVYELGKTLATEKSMKSQKPRSVYFIGNKKSGKSSSIYRFLDRSETPQATLALEYSFVHRPSSDGIRNDVCEIWELGGGNLFTNLLELVITKDNLLTCSLVLVLDLSAPEEIVIVADTLLDSLKRRIEFLSQQHNLVKELQSESLKRISSDHPDSSHIDRFLVPLLILGTKYDTFQNYENQHKKLIGRYLRLLAHINGAALQFIATNSESLMNKGKIALSQIAFDGNISGFSPVMDPSKPIQIPFGADSFQLIETDSLVLCKKQLIAEFPQVSTKVVIPDDPAKNANFREHDIDLIRSQKDQELEEYKRRKELSLGGIYERHAAE